MVRETTWLASGANISAVHNGVLATLISITMASAAWADQLLEGDAACDGLGTCTITNIDPVTSPFGSERLVVMIRDMMHLEIFDSDGFSLFAEFGIGNPNGVPVTVDFAYSFLDMSGNPVGPELFGSTIDIPASGGTGNPIFGPGAPEEGSFIFHGFEIALTCDACDAMTMLTASEIDMIELTNVDETSRVGIWVPEPSAALLLTSACLSVVGCVQRRSRSGPRLPRRP